MRRAVLVLFVLPTTLALLLAGCAGDEESGLATTDGDGTATADEQPAPDATATGDDDAAAPSTDGDAAVVEEGASGILVQFRGEQVTASIDDSRSWSCSTSGDGGFASVSFLDDAGNDVSIDYDEVAGTNVTLTLADGTNWNLAEDGVVNVAQDADGTYRMSLQVAETSTGETESADVRLSCG